jgi:hypothetical protein
MSSEDRTFEITLAMAGAISAGAYSGGVIDFLFEAIDEWYKLRQEAPNDYPSHNVSINAISGASAGAITGALAVASLRFGIPARHEPRESFSGYTLQSMYDAWVVNIDMLKTPSNGGLLSTSDLRPGRDVTSLLNSDVLEQIGVAAFSYAPQGGRLRALPYVSHELHLYLMLSNLRGVPYEVAFGDKATGGGYGMLNHGDRAHFIVNGLGSARQASSWAKGDPAGAILDVTTLPSETAEASSSIVGTWNVCLQSSLASSAFPIGLSPRPLFIDHTDFAGRKWPFPHLASHPLVPDFPVGYHGDLGILPRYAFTCVDGGLINNEPFEYAHYSLLDQNSAHNDSTAGGADRAVVMVDPFPELPEFNVRGDEQKRDIISVLVGMFSSLKDQSRFKPSELAAALDEDWYSRYLVGPRRYVKETSFPGQPEGIRLVDNAIACGLLGGFGGFLSRQFRDFDYQLGRYNCQRFLRESFVLDKANDIVKDWSDNAANNASFRPTTDDTSQRCIIPLVGRCAPPLTLLDWPRIDDAALNPIIDGIKQRANALFPQFRAGLRGRLARLATGVIWTLGVKSYLLDYVEWVFKSDLVKRDQYKAYGFNSVAERIAIAALAHPKYDYCSTDYIAELVGVNSQAVGRMLEPHKASGMATYNEKLDAWALTARKPSLWEGLRNRISIGPPTVAKPYGRE